MTEDQRLVGGEGIQSPALQTRGDTDSNLVKSPAPTAIEFHELKVLGFVSKQAWFHIENDGEIKHLAFAVGTPDH